MAEQVIGVAFRPLLLPWWLEYLDQIRGEVCAGKLPQAEIKIRETNIE
jgi:hypothetical protein